MSLSLSSTPKPNSEHSEQRSLDRQQILEEDEYTAALSHIIARDFFPSLVHLDATNNYLDAVSAHDPVQIQSTVRRLQELNTPASRRGLPNQTPSQTPYGAGPSDTPLPRRTPRDTDGPPPSKKPRFDDSLTLDTFQARYTSEDNASFTQILQDENRERRVTHAWAWDAQRRVELAKSRALEARERSLIEPPSVGGVRGKRFIEPPLPVAGLLTAGGEEEMDEEDRKQAVDDLTDEREVAVVLVEAEMNEDETGAIIKQDEVVDVLARKKDTRVATVDGWKFKARNSLMFVPDMDTDPHQNRANQDVTTPKVINRDNTRLEEHDVGPSRRASEPPSPTRSRVDAAIAGKAYRPKSPTINNFSLVAHMPSPTPEELGPTAVKQLMTWGSLNATPRILQSSDSDLPPDPNRPFHLPAPSQREAISHRLSNKASKDIRERANLMSTTPRRRDDANPKGSALGRTIRSTSGAMAPPTWTPGARTVTRQAAPAKGALTPAAKRLLERTAFGTAGARRADVMAQATGWEGPRTRSAGKDISQVRWTPTPARKT